MAQALEVTKILPHGVDMIDKGITFLLRPEQVVIGHPTKQERRMPAIQEGTECRVQPLTFSEV
jgi:hypothetical protein